MAVTTEALRELVDSHDATDLPPLSSVSVGCLEPPPELPVDLAIGEVAEITGIGAHTLRYYERIGLVEVRRDAGGRRIYDSEAPGSSAIPPRWWAEHETYTELWGGVVPLERPRPICGCQRYTRPAPDGGSPGSAAQWSSRDQAPDAGSGSHQTNVDGDSRSGNDGAPARHSTR